MFLVSFTALNPIVAQQSKSRVSGGRQLCAAGLLAGAAGVVLLIWLLNSSHYYLPGLIEDHRLCLLLPDTWRECPGACRQLWVFVLRPFSEGMALH